MSEIIWRPYGDYLTKSNIKRFMDRYGIKSYEELIRRSTEDVEWFWDACLKDLGVEWFAPYNKVMDSSKGFPWTKWFIGGKINIAHNCLDRHIRDGKGDKLCIIWEGDDGEVRRLSYQEVYERSNQVANALKEMGLKKGDTAGIYMPMTPEIVIAMMGCFKLGVAVVPIFSGFGSMAVGTRLEDAEAKVLFTADGGKRRGKNALTKPEADKALEMVPTIQKVVVFPRLGIEVPMKKGRDIFWDEFVKGKSKEFPTEKLEAEDYSLIIYTSGTTGKPKGTVHTHAGALAQMAKEVAYYFDTKAEDHFFWFTDIGWMMGPWEVIGVQFLGGTYLFFEGVPNWPEPDRVWKLLEDHKITIFGISPTAIRLMMTYEEKWLNKHDLSLLRILGSTGEPWDPNSYMWFFEKVGKKRCPIINISGGTEIVGCLLSPLPITELKPCTLRGPGLGMDIDVFDDEGKPIRGGIGHLVCKKPAPSMTKGFLKDPDRYLDTYFSKFGPNIWYHGDWAHVDEDGFWFLHGRSDDTIKVAGKRTGPAEVEAALNEHPLVQESAAIGVPDDIKGEAVVCFVVLKPGNEPNEKLREELKEQVVKHLGKTLLPKELKFVKALPKTRSAKIVRGAIKRKYLGKEVGDISTVENPDAIEEITKAI